MTVFNPTLIAFHKISYPMIRYGIRYSTNRIPPLRRDKIHCNQSAATARIRTSMIFCFSSSFFLYYICSYIHMLILRNAPQKQLSRCLFRRNLLLKDFTVGFYFLTVFSELPASRLSDSLSILKLHIHLQKHEVYYLRLSLEVRFAASSILFARICTVHVNFITLLHLFLFPFLLLLFN